MNPYEVLAKHTGLDARYLEMGKEAYIVRPCEAVNAMREYAEKFVEFIAKNGWRRNYATHKWFKQAEDHKFISLTTAELRGKFEEEMGDNSSLNAILRLSNQIEQYINAVHTTK